MGVKCILKRVISELFQGMLDGGFKLAAFIQGPTVIPAWVVAIINRSMPLNFVRCYKAKKNLVMGIGRSRTQCFGAGGIANSIGAWECNIGSITRRWGKMCSCWTQLLDLMNFKK